MKVETRWIKARPYIIGELCHCLPVACWTEEELARIRFRVHLQKRKVYLWFFATKWETTITLELTKQELLERMKDEQVQNQDLEWTASQVCAAEDGRKLHPHRNG